MKQIEVVGKGVDARLSIGHEEPPHPGPSEVRIRVRATAINHADLLQRRGLYPPPPGASAILGLECAGEIDALGSEVQGFALGDRVMALLPGGGYAEQAVVDAGSVLRVPEALGTEEAAALPEVYLTAYLNLFEIAEIGPGNWALVHGGGSGVGTAATGLLREVGAHCITTCGSQEKIKRSLELGADVALDYRSGPFAQAVREATAGCGVDVVLDSIGGPYLEQHLACLATDGRLVLIGLRGGAKAEINLGVLMTKRLRIVGSTLRPLPPSRKAEIVAGFWERFGPAIEAGRIHPVIDRVFPLADAQAAHDWVQASEHFGKVVLRMD